MSNKKNEDRKNKEEERLIRSYCLPDDENTEAETYSTNIVGLDDLLRGGLKLPSSENGLIILIKGQPGAGKTHLALQLAMGIAQWGIAKIRKENERLGPIADKLRYYIYEQDKVEIEHLLDERLKRPLPIKKQGAYNEKQEQMLEARLRQKIEIDDSYSTYAASEPIVPLPAALKWANNVLERISKIGEKEQAEISQKEQLISQKTTARDRLINTMSEEDVKECKCEIEKLSCEVEELKLKIEELRKTKQKAIVIDGLNLLSDKERHLFETENLVHTLRKRAMVGILAYEAAEEATSNIDYMADMIIKLRGEERIGPPKYYLNHLCIAKSRFQPSALGWHQYKITEKTGINVYPSIHFHVHQHDLINHMYGESMHSMGEQTDNSSADKRVPLDKDNSTLSLIIGKEKTETKSKAKATKKTGPSRLLKGSCTVVLGGRRTWKTFSTLDFLRAGYNEDEKKVENGLLVSLMGNQPTIVKQSSQLCRWYCPRGEDPVKCDNRKCYKHIFLLHFRPGCITTGEFFHILRKRLALAKERKKEIKRLVFWDLTQIEYRFPLLAQDQVFLPALMDYLKHKEGITSLYMGAANTEIAKSAGAIADNVVFAWADKNKKYLRENKAKLEKKKISKNERDEGYAFLVDRIEGAPKGTKLFFMSAHHDQLAPTDNILDEEQRELAKRDMIKDPEESNYDLAKSMIEEIRAMQGLPAKRNQAYKSGDEDQARKDGETENKDQTGKSGQ